ncbi:MAG: allophanate hydrolase subunit 1 [Actinomycetota bacterium]|nr:allophanate hydrolase subunit 1 [Actinomycetota bacterium]
MNVRTCGDTAILLDCEDLDEAQRWFAALEDSTDAVLGAKTVLLRGVPERLRALVARITPADKAADEDHPVLDIPTRYDGEDLAEVAGLTGLSTTEVVAAHTGSVWTVAFGGFAPGFAYLTDGDPRLTVPRRDSPRKAVPAGAVGLAGSFSGVYPRESPGGWQLIGHTTLAMWDLDREPPALLHAGRRVRFVEVL